jgi:hypothetical protein
MRWIEQERTNGFHFWTLEENRSIATLKFNPESKTFRLQYINHHLFFLEYTGVLQQRVALKSEYGVVLGKVQLQKHWQTGTIIVNDLKYYYSADHLYIHLYDKNKQLITNLAVDQINELSILELMSLVLAFVWICPSISTENPFLLVNNQAV